MSGILTLISKLMQLRLNRFVYEMIDDDSCAILTYYNGRRVHVTVPSEFDGHHIDEIGPRFMNNNRHIRSVKIKNGIGVIYEEAFEDCINLRSISLPASIREIHGQPFAGCARLSSITLSSDSDAIRLVDGMLIDVKSGRLVFCINRTSAKLDIPDGVRIITSYAFMYCSQLRTITIPSSIKKIEACAFRGSGITKIGASSDSIENKAVSAIV